MIVIRIQMIDYVVSMVRHNTHGNSTIIVLFMQSNLYKCNLHANFAYAIAMHEIHTADTV